MAGDIFLTAKEVRNNARAYLIVHQECRAIEEAILFAADSGLLDAVIYNTYMTQTVLPTWKNAAAVDTNNDTIIIPNHGFLNGNMVQFNTTGTLPTPLNVYDAYFLKVIDVDTLKVCSSYMDVINNVFIDISSLGTGTLQIRQISPEQQYNQVWKGQMVNRPLTDHMNGVIKHFEDLGYTIRRQSNPNTNGQTFWWSLAW